jgi:hypothetical protein
VTWVHWVVRNQPAPPEGGGVADDVGRSLGTWFR